MFRTSSNYIQQIRSNSREWDIYITVTLKDTTVLNLTKDDITLGTCTYTEGSTCSSTIQIGSTYSNSFSFTILNSNNKYTNYDFYKAKVQPYIGLYVPYETVDAQKKWRFEYVPIGVFWVLENVKRLSSIPIVCFDQMSLANKTFDFSQLVFPMKCSDLFNQVIAQCDITVSEDLVRDIQSLDYVISSLLTNDPTCRDILSGFGLMLGKNLRFNRTGVLEAFWYTEALIANDNTIYYTDKNTRVDNSSYGDNQMQITGVYLEDAYGNVFSVGTEEYAIELPTSPIIQGSDMATVILEQAFSKLKSVAHRVSSITYTGDPAVQAGDIIKHTNTPVGDVMLPVMRLVYKFAGTGTLESLGTDEATQNQSTSTDKKLKRAFARAEQDKSELLTKIEQTATEVLIQASKKFSTKEDVAQLQVQADNITSNVTQQTAVLEGLKTSVSQVQQDAENVSIKVQKILNDGVNSVTTETGYTFNADGMKVQKSGEEIANRIDHTGMYVERSGVAMLQANNRGVIASDLTARNYLIVAHARFESYGAGATACFWLQFASGQNILLNSGVSISNNEYNIALYTPSSPLVAGETYTISLCVIPDKAVTSYGVYLSNGYRNQIDLPVKGTDRQIVRGTFVASYANGRTPTDGPENALIALFRMPKDATNPGNSTICWCKVEIGDTPTDWSPAPED